MPTKLKKRRRRIPLVFKITKSRPAHAVDFSRVDTGGVCGAWAHLRAIGAFRVWPDGPAGFLGGIVRGKGVVRWHQTLLYAGGPGFNSRCVHYCHHKGNAVDAVAWCVD